MHLRPSGGFELWTWVFMRVSGVLLLFLAVGHFLLMHVINPVETISYAFVAKRFSFFFWRAYDLLMLWLAMLHGINGVRILVDDYVHSPRWHRLWYAGLGIVGGSFLILGTWVIAGF